MADLFDEAQLAKGVVEMIELGAFCMCGHTGWVVYAGDFSILGKGQSIPEAWIDARNTVERRQMAKLNEEASRREQDTRKEEADGPLWKHQAVLFFIWCLAVTVVAGFFYYAAEASVWFFRLAARNPFGMVCCVVPVVLVVGLWRDKGGK